MQKYDLVEIWLVNDVNIDNKEELELSRETKIQPLISVLY